MLLIMQYMFLKATSFNQDISNWNAWKVTTMRSMFNSASALIRILEIGMLVV